MLIKMFKLICITYCKSYTFLDAYNINSTSLYLKMPHVGVLEENLHMNSMNTVSMLFPIILVNN
jgi:hypothetical protein